MKAVVIDRFGGPEVLSLREVPDPTPGPGQVVVEIHAVTVNPADCKAREGYRPRPAEITFPWVLGRDFSGVVRALGEGVTDLAPGDAVFAVTETSSEGAYAEAIAIDAGLVARKPPSLGHVEAASVALIGLTSLVALEDDAKLKRGEKILVHAGAGGVGGFAIQYAHHVGARVVTTARARNHDYVRGLGADEAIDYTAVDFAAAVKDCDVVFDTVGGEVHQKSFAVLKPGGRLLHIVAPPEGAERPRSDVTVIRPNVRRDRAHLDRITELVESGAVRPLEITRMPLAAIAEAHRLSETGHVRGKIVLEVRR